MMSCVPVAKNDGESCANCGKQGSDIVKLKNCNGLPPRQVLRRGMPEGPPQAAQEGMQEACSRAQGRGAAVQRRPLSKNGADVLVLLQARVVKKDPEAINFLGERYGHGVDLGLQKDARKAVALWTEAAELGSLKALYNLEVAHERGLGVQGDEKKSTEFYRKAAMQGHVASRHNLGGYEGRKGNHDPAVRHFLISAKMGCEESVQNIKGMFMAGVATKEQCGAGSLRPAAASTAAIVASVTVRMAAE
ncbi:hypothetical protein THAOC_10374, partial [Thalassiosira oceanica]